MAVKMGIYKCEKCGNVVEVLVEGKSPLVCCGVEMKLLDEKNKDGAGEKHLPVIEEKDGGILVKVGAVPHPMEADHWIQFIEVLRKDGKVGRRDLNPGDKPEAFFLMARGDILHVRELCSKHGLWSI